MRKEDVLIIALKIPVSTSSYIILVNFIASSFSRIREGISNIFPLKSTSWLYS